MIHYKTTTYVMVYNIPDTWKLIMAGDSGCLQQDAAISDPICDGAVSLSS
jgi:hypothetical protein